MTAVGDIVTAGEPTISTRSGLAASLIASIVVGTASLIPRFSTHTLGLVGSPGLVCGAARVAAPAATMTPIERVRVMARLIMGISCIEVARILMKGPLYAS